MKNYKKLKIWNQGIKVVQKTYELTKILPEEEKFGLVSQMTRAAVSIPANIAEGSSRNSDKDYARFLRMALGSAFELQTYLVLVKELEMVKIDFFELEELLESEIKMIHGMIRKVSQ